MRALLMYRNQDFDPDQSLRYYPTYGDRKIDPRERLLPHERALIQDLELDPLLGAMANGDEFLLEVAERALLSGLRNDLDTILYRQGALKDCLRNPTVVQQLYGLAVEAIDGTRRRWWDMTGHYTSTVLYAALDLLEASLSILRKLRGVAEDQAGRVESEAFSNLFAMLRKELSDEYLGTVKK